MRWWVAVVAVVGAVVAGTGVSLLRHPGMVALDTLYAEDGAVFLADAADGAPVSAIGTTYAGYYHLVPRLLGALAAGLPASAAAAVMAITAAAITAGLAVLVYVISAGHLASPVARVLVAAPVVVAPLAQQEIPNSVANLHWPALYVLFWLLIWTPAGRGGRVVAVVAVAATALSDILVVAFLPLAAVRLLVRRDRYSAILGTVLTAGVAVQLAGMLIGSGSRDDIAPGLRVPVTSFFLRTVPATVLGERWLPQYGTEPLRLAMAAAASLLVAAALVAALRRLSQPQWPLALAAGAYCVVFHLLPVILTGAAPRYALVPGLLLIATLVALLYPHPRPTGPRSWRAAAPLLVLTVVFAVVWALNFQIDVRRNEGPRWHPELDRAQVECVASGSGAVDVPITPNDLPWTATLSCGYLTR